VGEGEEVASKRSGGEALEWVKRSGRARMKDQRFFLAMNDGRQLLSIP
jgi:hypothetical protein